MPYGLRGYGLGDCINTDAQGVGVDSVTSEACVKTGVSTVAAVPVSGATQYGAVVDGQVIPITPGTVGGGTFSQWISTNGLYVGLGAAFFFLMMGMKRR